MRLAFEHKDIREYTIDPLDFRLPAWMAVPKEVHEAQIGLLKKANGAINAMKQLMEYREKRYFALCPVTADNTYEAHKASIKRLFQWKPDWSVANPTLAPASKIPHEGFHLHLDPKSYAAFTVEYINLVEVLIAGPYSSWIRHKFSAQQIAFQAMKGVDYMSWCHWWNATFLTAMWKWEVCLDGLTIPSWEEVVDELYLMVLDRVEDASELANALCSSRRAPPMNTQSELRAAEYFATSD